MTSKNAPMPLEQMISDGWRQCARGQHTTQFCGQLEEAVKAEREACLKLAEEYARHHMGVSLWPFVDLLRKMNNNAQNINLRSQTGAQSSRDRHIQDR